MLVPGVPYLFFLFFWHSSSAGEAARGASSVAGRHQSSSPLYPMIDRPKRATRRQWSNLLREEGDHGDLQRIQETLDTQSFTWTRLAHVDDVLVKILFATKRKKLRGQFLQLLPAFTRSGADSSEASSLSERQLLKSVVLHAEFRKFWYQEVNIHDILSRAKIAAQTIISEFDLFQKADQACLTQYVCYLEYLQLLTTMVQSVDPISFAVSPMQSSDTGKGILSWRDPSRNQGSPSDRSWNHHNTAHQLHVIKQCASWPTRDKPDPVISSTTWSSREPCYPWPFSFCESRLQPKLPSMLHF